MNLRNVAENQKIKRKCQMMLSFKIFSDRNKGSGLTGANKFMSVYLEGRNTTRQKVVYINLHNFVM